MGDGEKAGVGDSGLRRPTRASDSEEFFISVQSLYKWSIIP